MSKDFWDTKETLYKLSGTLLLIVNTIMADVPVSSQTHEDLTAARFDVLTIMDQLEPE